MGFPNLGMPFARLIAAHRSSGKGFFKPNGSLGDAKMAAHASANASLAPNRFASHARWRQALDFILPRPWLGRNAPATKNIVTILVVNAGRTANSCR